MFWKQVLTKTMNKSRQFPIQGLGRLQQAANPSRDCLMILLVWYFVSVYFFFLVGWDLRHQVLRPLLAYCTAPDDR
jgi:hypothetical protein